MGVCSRGPKNTSVFSMKSCYASDSRTFVSVKRYECFSSMYGTKLAEMPQIHALAVRFYAPRKMT